MDDERAERVPVYLPGIDLSLWFLIIVFMLVGASIVTTSMVLIVR